MMLLDKDLSPFQIEIMIRENLSSLNEKIIQTTTRCGRGAADIKLVAVSKTKPASDIKLAFEAGQRVFGENYAQELRDKAKELGDLAIEWHFIGHLQKNKVKHVAPVANFVETIDSIELATAINERAPRKINCLIEVNVGSEGSKSGVAEGEVIKLAEKILLLPNIDLRGLMIIPPFDTDASKSRPYFKKLKQLLAQLNEELKPARPFNELSMGMSHDFEVAIEEGATIIRVGTAIFGGRWAV